MNTSMAFLFWPYSAHGSSRCFTTLPARKQGRSNCRVRGRGNPQEIFQPAWQWSVEHHRRSAV